MTLHKLDHTSPPSYSPSAPSPRYSYEPTSDERRLQLTPSSSRPAPTGTFIKKSGKVTVTLFEQLDGTQMPTYGRNGLISGAVYLENCTSISSITLKVDGKLISTCESGSRATRLLNKSYTLWQENKHTSCSNCIPFSVLLPPTFEDRGSTHPLPPSYHTPYRGVPGFFIRSNYDIRIRVERIRYRRLGFLSKIEEIRIPFEYHPRTRAHHPIVSCPCLFSTVKSSPGEWYQIFTQMETKTKTELEPVHCHLFIPSAKVFGLSDKIPFHIQINGSLSSLRKFILYPPGPSTERKPLCAEPSIKISLLRQMVIEFKEQKVWRNIIIGKGKLREVPPMVSPSYESENSTHLDWEGELECDRELVSVGGFSTGDIKIRDFITLEILPPVTRHEVSPFLALHMTVPIRLVTDSYTEETDYEVDQR